MSLEIKKLQAERARVFAARLDMECRQEEIKIQAERLNDQIKIQLDKEVDLDNKLKEMGEQ